MIALTSLIIFVLQVASVRGQQCVHCPDYAQASAAVKESIIMEKLVSTEYAEIPRLKGICDIGFDWREDVDFNNQFDRFSDERPNLPRFFHSNAMVANVKLVASNEHNLTGIFRGAEHGVLRFSPLAPILDLDFLTNHFLGTILFSFGLKFFRDSIHSANILTGDSQKGLNAFSASRNFWDKPDFNIFSRTLDNMPGIAGNGPLFGEFERLSGVISAADVAAYDVAGTEETEPVTPIVVHFRPNPVLNERFKGQGEIDFRKWAIDDSELQAGAVLYTIYTTVDKTTGEPSLCVDDNGTPQVDDDVELIWCPEQKVIRIGDVVLKSRFYASQWGDDSLFFQHTRACPKDQAICANTNPSVLTEPYTTYAETTITDSVACFSDSDLDGTLGGIPPACPAGSTVQSDYCYPGDLRHVEETQVLQCPFLTNSLNNEILGFDQPEQAPAECSFFSILSRDAFGFGLGTISFFIRGFLWPFQILGIL